MYSLVKYGYPVTGEGGAAFEGADVPYVGADGFCSPVGAGWRNIVTSEFGGRIDPITGQRDGHTGMDLGVPTGTPIVLAGLLTGGWRVAVWQVVLVALQFAIYLPFFKMMDKQALAEEAQETANV